MEGEKKVCSVHYKDGKYFCEDCCIYLCDKCEIYHSSVFLKHQLYDLNKESVDEILKGRCQIEYHNKKFQYFCKTHNILCCGLCISKIEDDYNGQHSECDVCLIEDIQDEKKNNLKKNIETLKAWSDELDIYKFERFLKKKEKLKLEIQEKFSKIREALNHRESNILYNLEKEFNDKCFKEYLIEEARKLSPLLEKGETIIKEWDDDKLFSNLNICINIEEYIKTMNDLKKDIEKYNLEKIPTLCFEENSTNEILEKINSFGSINIKKYRILMLGLDSAGKTALLYQLKYKKEVKTIPTISFNVETVDYKGKNLTIWDIGGQDKLRSLWNHYYQNTDGIIFVVDSKDEGRIEEASKEIKKLVNEEALKKSPILIFANKQDLKESLAPDKITEKLGMGCLKGRTWLVQGSEAITGRGVFEGLDWLYTVL